jgi:hypothetical protein
MHAMTRTTPTERRVRHDHKMRHANDKTRHANGMRPGTPGGWRPVLEAT